MKTEWTKGIDDPQLVADIKGAFAGSLVLRKRLTALAERKVDANNRQAMGKEGYDSPNWAYRQADAQGYNRALSEIISLIS